MADEPTLKDIKGIGDATEGKLTDAGVETVADLAAADVAELAEETGISESQLQGFQDHARELAGESPADKAEKAVGEAVKGAKETAEKAAEAIRRDRVVLSEKFQTARVKLGEVWHEEVPIVTARAGDELDKLKDTSKETVVVLKEKADTAWARIEGTWHEELPIFKRRVQQIGDELEETGEEIRVRVHEVRDRAAKAAKDAADAAGKAAEGATEKAKRFKLPFGKKEGGGEGEDGEGGEGGNPGSGGSGEEEEGGGGFSLPFGKKK